METVFSNEIKTCERYFTAVNCLTHNPTLLSVCDEMRLSVEFVTVGFLGICRQYCD